MQIFSHFTPRVKPPDSNESSPLGGSGQKKLNSALRAVVLGALSVAGVCHIAQAQDVQVRTNRGLVSAKAGQLLVKFGSAAPTSLTAIRSNIGKVRSIAKPINSRIGASELQSFGSTGWQLVKLPAGMSLEEGLAYYKAQPGVSNVEPDALRYMKAVPNDPSYGQQYGLTKIGAPIAWNKSGGSTNTIVAIIDSGVNYTHEDLTANMWRNPKEIVGNGKDDDGNGYIDDVYGIDAGDHDSDPMDANHHGTHCAGIIGAKGNNGIGVVGVNWSVKLMAVKVMNNQGSIPSSSVLEGMQYVLTMKARGNNIRVINESLGGPTFVQAEKDAFDALNTAGVLVAAAAGNETTNNDAKASYPASYDCPNIISVAASDQQDAVASFSNYGATSVDLAAPGVDIYSTFWPGNSAYSNLSGTSMATPMVAGAAALLAAYSPTQTPATLKKLLMDTVDPLPQWDGKVVTGGRMNLARAVNVLDPNGKPTVVSATHGVSSALRPSIVVNFSKPMDTASVQSNWSFSPTVSGTFTWSNSNQTVTFTPSANLLAGTRYQGRIKGTALSATGVQLDGNASQSSTGSPSDDYVWNIRIAGLPANDMFAKATVLSGDTGSIPSFNIGATREAGEPRHGNYYGNGTKSVWFKWKAPATGNLLLNTTGSDFSHVIAVYSGSTLTTLLTEKTADSNFTGRSIITELRVTAGVTYSIAIDGDYYPPTETTPEFTDDGNIQLAWQLYRSPSNDNYAYATLISGTSGTTTGNTLGSYYENGEPSHIGADSSVWFKWLAPAAGMVTFDTKGTGWDTALSVFKGSTIGTAVEVAHDADGGGTGGTSSMPFTVSANTVYYISVGGAGYAFYDARGDFKLNWKFVNGPTNDLFAKATALVPVTGGTVNGTTNGATIEANEPEVQYRDGLASIWYTWTAPSNGVVSFDTTGSSFDTNLAAFTGTALTSLIEVDHNDDNESIANATTSKIKFTAVKSTIYRIRIDSPTYASSEASIGYPATHGAVKLTWSFATAPSNDLFAAAQLLPGTNGAVVGSNVGANIEAQEPQPTYRDTGASIWYKWVAPSNGAVMFDAAGSKYTDGTLMNTHMAVYTGSGLAGLTSVQENDDDASNAPSETSRVRFTVYANTVYYIRLDNNRYAPTSDSGKAYDATHGIIPLTWSFVTAPSNDKFASYLDLGSATSGNVSGTTVGAGLEPNEENPTYRDTSCSVWYRWKAPVSGNVTFSTAGSKNVSGLVYDTYLAIYTGTAMNSLEWVTTNDDDGALPTSKAIFAVTAGTTYIIRCDGTGGYTSDSVQSFNAIHGTMNLSWSLNNAAAVGPTISSFTPASGKDGTVVTINGVRLTGTTKVTFDGMDATIGTITDTQITATAPVGVRTGRIWLQTSKGSTTSSTDFKVVPTITAFSPTAGPVGTTVTIDGSGFSGITNVTIGGAVASFTLVSPTRLTAVVPPTAVSGKISVTTAGGTAVSAGIFTVQSGTVTTYSVSGRVTLGTAGLAGVTITSSTGPTAQTDSLGNYTFTGIVANTTLTLTPSKTGYSFTPASLTLTVTSANVASQNFAATAVAPTTYTVTGRITEGTTALANVTVAVSNGTSVKTNATGDYTIPGLAANTTVTLTPSLSGYTFNPTSLSVTVTNANVTGKNFAATKVTVPATPTISSFTPASGPVGTTVTITGTNLTGATAVKFNGIAATITSNSATQIVVTVPTGATTGNITVTTSGGTATSTTAFTVTTATTDTTAPTIAFKTPAANSSVSSLTSVTGAAADSGSGVKAVYLQLYRVSDDGQSLTAVYDWVAGAWGTDDTLDSTITQAKGTTTWSVTMPSLPVGNYAVYATALDNANPSNQSAWILRTFTIVAPLQSSAKAS